MHVSTASFVIRSFELLAPAEEIMATKSTIERKLQTRDVFGWVAIIAAALTFSKYAIIGMRSAYAFMLTREGVAVAQLVVGLVSVATFVTVLIKRRY